MSKPEQDYDSAWYIQKFEDGWYYYDWRGAPIGPYISLDKAWEALDDYSYDYFADDE
jgi:hypothetical protein